MSGWGTRLRVGNGAIFVGFLFLVLGFWIASLSQANAATGINQQLNYQARLLDNTGAVVPDGNYNMEFKIYQDGNGVLGGGDETLKWTETRTGIYKVTVKNGYFSIQLGSVNAFDSNIDWNQDTLWLSTNVGGTDTPTWDGEMSPFRRLGSSAYSLNSNRLGGLQASDFLQLAPASVQTDATTNNTVFVNKTGASGNILQLQKNGSDVFSVNNSGLATFSNGISVGGETVTDLSGNGLVVSSNTLNIRLDTTAADGSSTSSVSGLEFVSGELSLLRGCAANEILKWDNAAFEWDCAADQTGGGGGSLQGAYDGGGSGDQVIALDNAQDSVIFRNPSSNGTDSGYVVSIDQLNTGAVDGLRIASVGTGALLKITDGTATAADVLTVADGGVTTFKSQTNDANAFRVLNASNAEVFAVNTATGQVRVNGGGIEFNETDSNPTCAAGNYTIFADLSETKLKKCVNGVASDIDAGTKEEIITATGAGTWTKPSDALLVIVDVFGAGGGGGGGASNTGAVVRVGGSGGGGGAHASRVFSAANLGSTENYSVGAGGTVGTGGASGASGTSGGTGGNTTFGTTNQLFAGGGGGGRLGANSAAAGAGGGGGGTGQAGTVGGTGATAGGGPGVSNTTASGGQGGSGTATATAGIGAEWGGGGGGSHTNVPANGPGGTSVYGGGGGGTGGGATVTPATVNATAGGGTGTFSASGGGGGGAGTSGTTPTVGTAGSNGNTVKAGAGGGGGGGTITASTAGAVGGGGGAPSGGGGGGGVGSNTSTGGNGGVGGRGELRIWTLRGSGADLAEVYCTNDTEIVAGDTVAIDPALRAGVKKTSKAYDSSAVGIIATNPGLIIGTTEEVCAKPVLVALVGRVPLKVSLENGPIRPGDMLAASSTPGVAMKAKKSGTIVGQALTAYDGSMPAGYVVAFVKNGQGTGSSLLDQLPGLADMDDADLSRQALDHFVQSQAAIQTTNISEIMTDRLSAGVEIITPKLTADQILANSIEPATGAGISIKLAHDGVLAIVDQQGETVISFDSNGNAHFTGDVEFEGTATFNNNAAGFVKIDADETEARVTFSKPYPTLPIVHLTVSNGVFMSYAYKDLTVDGFTIMLSEPATVPVEFSWSAISVKDAQTSSNDD